MAKFVKVKCAKTKHAIAKFAKANLRDLKMPEPNMSNLLVRALLGDCL